MATWQQGINSGGFLAGIGTQNENAPKASDINATLGLIRENNELARSGANNVGLTALRGLAGVADIYKQQQKQERKAAFQKGYADAYASGDREQMRNLITAFPEEFEEVRKGMGYVDDAQRDDFGNLALKAQVASSLGPGAFGRFMMDSEKEMRRLGIPPETIAEMQVNDPQGFQHFAGNLALFSLGHEKYFDIKDRMEGRRLEGERNQLTSRGQDITMRGQDLSAATARRGQDLAMQRASMKGAVGNNERTVQLADGRTVTVGGKLHGAGANAFYEGIDNEGNMVRVPAGSIAAPATSAASAQNYAMKKDLDAISGASIDDLGFMTGITGSSGSPALGADIRSRASGGDQRKLYNAAQRIQGKMQNQGIAAARDMGASGINTVAEAKMYFQGMPQVDFSSPEALQQSMRDIQQYTDNYNQQYNVNVGKSQRQQSQPTQVSQPAASSNFSSLWGD
ncbi:DNA transfer protein [Salmonella enterica subsp. enterica serovar Kentucky]|uniref:DNA transfer protein n=1 Tax=Salmonella enterica subsp. enterica serovar Kentucky TaxID=192955 RepID=A0A5V7EIC9_SALET|nr:phage DNA ejection protein [Salmonella enterica]EAA5811675.1 DNA transfer protein [Salmonella enterica subsp. enterica]EAA6541343.1 DNA transfer protein [Salmonella enterica subsp. enterica serovar Blockley]ECI7699228.1 DNA transfer protein [Salmonella enterica subsp. enterica serovar Agona]EDA4997164.1 DNA transfer protein [Salmonella enterica subsp. enterica serovar Newport]EIQ4678534.1 phage DNA ejection protein [Salmonella enterica subsp. enterica serovar Stanleyville]